MVVLGSEMKGFCGSVGLRAVGARAVGAVHLRAVARDDPVTTSVGLQNSLQSKMERGRLLHLKCSRALSPMTVRRQLSL